MGLSINWIRKIKNGWKVLTAWYIYNIKALNHLKKQKNEFIVINYSELLCKDDEFKRLQKFINLELHDCRKNKLYRSRIKQSIFYNVLVWINKIFFYRDIKKVFNQIKNSQQKAYYNNG